MLIGCVSTFATLLGKSSKWCVVAINGCLLALLGMKRGPLLKWTRHEADPKGERVDVHNACSIDVGKAIISRLEAK
jgi:hypothetical protein